MTVCVRLILLSGLAAVLPVPVLATPPPANDSKQVEASSNVVKSIRTREELIEIELESSTPFPVRGEVTVLRIGAREFARSRYPDDGRLTTLIFSIPAAAFESLLDGDEITVGYGTREAFHLYQRFGKLNKALLNAPN